MDSAQTTTQPTTFRGTFHRHRRLLSIPLVLGVLGAAAVIATHKSSYMSTASLWVDTAPPSASSVGPGAASLPTTPASAEQSLLSELITTNQFAVAVANGSLLGRSIGSQAQIDAKAATYLTSAQVGSIAAGPQVLALSYTAPSAAMARSVLNGIINELIREGSGLTATHAQQSVAYYKALGAQQSSSLATASANVQAYLSQHPNATSQSSPTLSALVSAENALNQQLAQTNSALSQAKGLSGSGWMVDVIDRPSSAVANALGKKKMLEVLIGGLFGGALISFLGVVALLPNRPKERWEDELLAGSIGEQWVADPSRAGLALTSLGHDQSHDHDEAGAGHGRPESARERRSGRTVSWHR